MVGLLICVQTLQPLILIYRRGNFEFLHLGCKSIFRPLICLIQIVPNVYNPKNKIMWFIKLWVPVHIIAHSPLTPWWNVRYLFMWWRRVMLVKLCGDVFSCTGRTCGIQRCIGAHNQVWNMYSQININKISYFPKIFFSLLDGGVSYVFT